MKFRYIGEYPAGQTTLVCFGSFEFSQGVAVELPEPFAAKARGNRFFEACDEGILVAAPEVVTDEALSKPVLIAQAEQLGIKIDKRLSADKIADKIKAYKLYAVTGATQQVAFTAEIVDVV